VASPTRSAAARTAERIRRGFDHHEAEAPELAGFLGGGLDGGRVSAVREAVRLDAEIGQGAAEQGLRAAIERLAVQDDIAGPRGRQDGGRDRRHAGAERQSTLSGLVDG
jgi:hypothetical protein